MKRQKKGVLFFMLCLACYSVAIGQQAASLFSNLRFKNIPVRDSLKIDSLSIASNSFFIEGYDDRSYNFYPETSLLVWELKPSADSVSIHYRVLPVAFGQRYKHKSLGQVNNDFVSLIYRHDELSSNSFINTEKLEYNGSYGRSITVGNNQDVVLNSAFNLQVNGYILDSIKLEAAITDNTIPFQPEGNTQRLQEFDQIYIRLQKNKHYLQLGDYSLDAPPGYFLKFYKRVQGVYYQTEFDISKRINNKLGLSGSVAKGQFARNIFQGQEGNQGPYKLTGNNGELFFIVLAGTERVFVDNMIMERGENADYIIDYNTAEVRFMARRMITKDSRIQIEYEYQDRNYLNSLVYAWDEMQIGKKWNVRLNAYSNQDAKNQPYQQNLSGAQKIFLSDIGDSIGNAFYPVITEDTFAANKILYKIIDSTVNAVLYDSVFVYSTNPDSARFSLSFSFVGAGRGDYILSSNNANGRVYDWIAPVSGIPQGNYAPVQLLVTPKKQQVFIVTTNYAIDSFKNLNLEVGASNADPNLFSAKDNNTHWGGAARIKYDELRALGKKDSTGKRKWSWQNELSYEFVQDRFLGIAPYRSVEFGRDWNVPLAGRKPDEHLAHAATRLSNDKLGTAAYRFSMYQRGIDYTGLRNILGYDYLRKRIRVGFVGNWLHSTDSIQHSEFIRPSVYGEYHLKELMNTYIGARYDLEHNALKSTKADSLLPTAFSFDISTIYLKTSDQQPARWSINYFLRRDRLPHNNDFIQLDHSHNVDLKLGLYQWKDQQLNFTGTYRIMVVDDTSLNNLKPEETLLGRLEYSGSLLKRVVTLNTLYEFGSGQEQKRSYIFIEVPAGQGVYTWNDYNGDGVQQATEFEIAIYQDQKRFIRLLTPTNEYVKVNYVNFNFSLGLEPASFWQQKEIKRWQKFISRLSSQTSLQINNRLLADERLNAYNPFVNALNENSIITTVTSISNSIYFNRNQTKWGVDYNLLYNTGKQLLTYGVEGNQSAQHLGKIRWNIVRPITFYMAGKYGDRSYHSALEDNRSYEVNNISAEPSVSWLHQSSFRVTGSYRYEQRENAIQFGGEHANIQSLNLELRYSKPSAGLVQIRGAYSNILFDGNIADPVAFIMLDALQKGGNYLWYMNWERRISKGIEVSLEYEGRKPGQTAVIHTGRMSVRAIL